MKLETHKMSDTDLARALDNLLREARFRHHERWTALETVAMQEIASKMNKIARYEAKK